MIRIVLFFSFLTAFLNPAEVISKSISYKNTAQGTPTTHKVVPKETLYSISKQYGVSVSELQKANPEAKNGLKVGQVLNIPAKTTAVVTTPKTEEAAPVVTPKSKPTEPVKSEKPTPVAENGQKIHKVLPKQNLYTIAIANGVTMAQIRKWNNLKSDALKPGQLLIVSETSKEPVTAQEKTPEPEAPKTVVTKSEVKVKGDKVKTKTKTETDTEMVKEEAKPIASEKEETAEVKVVESAGKVTETGLAEVIAQTNDNNKYLALHKTAPIGTILQIKNIMNGQDVYVRVIGKLPDTGANDKVIVRISKKAYQRLAAIDNRFRVEVSYMP